MYTVVVPDWLKVGCKEIYKPLNLHAKKKLEFNFHLRVELFRVLRATPRGIRVIYRPNQMCSKEAVCACVPLSG